jgi:hypothetical protein
VVGALLEPIISISRTVVSQRRAQPTHIERRSLEHGAKRGAEIAGLNLKVKYLEPRLDTGYVGYGYS